MKTCEEIRDNISLYIDNELDEKSVTEFEQHIDECENCKKELDEIKTVVEACLSTSDEEDLPEGFYDNLHEKLVLEKAKMTGKNKVIRVFGKYAGIFSSAAAVLLIAFLVYGVWNNQGKSGITMKDEAPADLSNNYAGSYGKKDLKELKKALESEVQVGSSSEQPPKAEIDRALGQYGGEGELYSFNKEPSKENNNEVTNFGRIIGDKDTANASAYTISQATPAKASDVKTHRAGPDTVFDLQPTANNDVILPEIAATSVSIQNVGNVTIYSDNADGLAGEVKKLAAGFEEQSEEGMNGSINLTLTSEAVEIKVLASRYDEFIDLLKSKYGQENITADHFKSEDFAKKLEELNSSLSQLEGEITAAEKNGASLDELQEMKAQRDNIVSEIENYRNASKYVNIFLEIREK